MRPLLQRPEQRLAEPVAIALRLGAFQLLHMDRIPAHAALSESVELCRAAGEPHAAGMVNAILRKIAGSPKPGVKLHETTAAFAERLGHPAWMVERWVKSYGRAAAMKICEADQTEPAEGSMFAESGGDWPQMDDGSRLVAEIAAAAMPAAGRVWDCCAAPGGKTLVLARRLASAEIVASDVSAKRLAQMETRLHRYGYAKRVRFEVADAADAKAINGSFDLILCDAPCSGTGTMAGNPEIRHRLKVEELARQAARQRAILSGRFEAPVAGWSARLFHLFAGAGGVSVRVDAVGGVRRVPVEELIAELEEQGTFQSGVKLDSAVQNGALRTLPGVNPGDGFYAVVLERE